MNKRFVLLGAAAALIATLAVATATSAQVTRGKTRPLTTKQLMAGMVKPNSAALGELLKGNGPADEKAWETAAAQAALLNESGHIMMADGRCPDTVWAEACKVLIDASASLISKVEARDGAGARDAYTAMVKSCGSCHKAHKK